MFSDPLIFAFCLTLFAGLSTGIGSLLCLMYKKFNPKFLGIMLGLSAGVMLYVSFVEILAKAKTSLSNVFGDKLGYTYAIIGFFVGILLIILIDKILPHHHNHENEEESTDQKLLRLGLFSAVTLSIHNFPEGLATFTAAISDPKLGIPIAVAIAIHNIPEGIAVAVPIFYATGSKMKAFKLSFLSGLSEPVGALVGYLILYRWLNDTVFGIIFASVAGIMVYISLDELLPSAREYGEHHLSIYGMVAGMAVMAISLLLFL